MKINFVFYIFLFISSLSCDDFNTLNYELSHFNSWLNKNTLVSEFTLNNYLEKSEYFLSSSRQLHLKQTQLDKLSSLNEEDKNILSSKVLKEFWGIVTEIDRYFDQSYDTDQKYDSYIDLRDKWRPFLNQLTLMIMNADHESWQSTTNHELYILEDGWFQNSITLSLEGSQVLKKMYETLEDDDLSDLNVHRTQTMQLIESLYKKSQIENSPLEFKCYKLKKCSAQYKSILNEVLESAQLYMK
ncbi:MAG: hypothetical protein COB02_07645 [Candidatus Cloacimonadota bacterium]|nr:MAG: hypothetical protein COB02_07645 [Candidatus Cloacimonadota bacterium]